MTASALYESLADLHEKWLEDAARASAAGQAHLATHLRNTAETIETLLDAHIAEAA